eukprot:CAMPEP_0178951360 /NCGR_PEP_ID=MMETSP0789-20121207/7181_1 /TAXON_ID=3005 /ORGANISM="Rhizosolenia setigera, Strain CCMP 1694" /LENGTH=221 /DNA_ID=CAMNT_0020632221 /DNA_START=107 /DNA_END=772 /DNA_ORIENTATION=+
MVRAKKRYIIVQFDFQENLKTKNNTLNELQQQNNRKRKWTEDTTSSSINPELTKSIIQQTLHESMIQCFGQSVGIRSMVSTQVRYYDPEFRLCIIRTDRDSCSYLQSSLFFLTHIGGANNSSSNGTRGGEKTNNNVSATVKSISGSPRTMKMSMFHILRNLHLNQSLQEINSKKKKVATAQSNSNEDIKNEKLIYKRMSNKCNEKESKKLQDKINIIQGID